MHLCCIASTVELNWYYIQQHKPTLPSVDLSPYCNSKLLVASESLIVKMTASYFYTNKTLSRRFSKKKLMIQQSFRPRKWAVHSFCNYCSYCGSRKAVRRHIRGSSFLWPRLYMFFCCGYESCSLCPFQSVIRPAGSVLGHLQTTVRPVPPRPACTRAAVSPPARKASSSRTTSAKVRAHTHTYLFLHL